MKIFDVVLLERAARASSISHRLVRYLAVAGESVALRRAAAQRLLDALPQPLLVGVSDQRARAVERDLRDLIEVREVGERLYCADPQDPARGDQPLQVIELRGVRLLSGPIGDSRITEHVDAPAARSAFLAAAAERTRAGWFVTEDRRAIHPALVARDEALEAAIARDPDDTEAYLVYGDWLQQRGDPRGELLAVQHALAATDEQSAAFERARLEHSEVGLLERHHRHLLGDLVDSGAHRHLQLTWLHGFIDGARIELRTGLDVLDEPGVRALLRTLTSLPSAALLRGLTCHANDTGAVARALIEVGPPGTLTRLALGSDGFFDARAYFNAGPVAELLPLVADGLRELALGSLYIDLGERPALPRLERLSLVGAIDANNLRAMADADWPRLQRLELGFHRSLEYPTPDSPDPAAFLTLLNAPRMPELRELALKRATGLDGLAGSLSRTILLSQLRRLDLSGGDMTDRGAQLLLESAGAFVHLERLDLGQNSIGALCQPLAEAVGPCLHLGCQR